MKAILNKVFFVGILIYLLFLVMACNKDENLKNDDFCISESGWYFGILMTDSIADTDDEIVTQFFENLLSPWHSNHDSCDFLYLAYNTGYYYYAFVCFTYLQKYNKICKEIID